MNTKLILFFASLFYFFILEKTEAATFTAQVKKPNHSLLFRSKKKFLEFRPNASLHWGVKLSGSAFYIEYGQKIKDTNYGKSEVGNNSYKSYRIGLPLANTYTELYYQEWLGFSSDENKEEGCEYCLERENLSSRERSVHFLIATNSNFSMKALNSNGSEGVKFSHSPLVMVFGNRLKFRDYGGLLQGNSNQDFQIFSELTSLEMQQVGLGLGYAALIPLGPLYFGISGVIGGGYQENEREKLDGTLITENDYSSHWNVKAMIASHNKNINIGLKGWFFSNVYEIGDSNNAASLNYNLYAYLSFSW